jgi:acyl carrier protein
MRRLGVAPLSTGHALSLLDAALGGDRAGYVPARLDFAALRTRAGSDGVPAILRGLVRAPARSVPKADTSGPGARSDADRVTAAPAADRPRVVRELLRGHIAAVLGHPDGAAFPADRGLMDLGFDSLAAVELRNRLNAAFGLRLPTTLMLDYPTVGALADHLHREVAAAIEEGPSSSKDLVDELAAALAANPPGEEQRAHLVLRLRSLLTDLGAPAVVDDFSAALVDSASDEELFNLIDQGPNQVESPGS